MLARIGSWYVWISSWRCQNLFYNTYTFFHTKGQFISMTLACADIQINNLNTSWNSYSLKKLQWQK